MSRMFDFDELELPFPPAEPAGPPGATGPEPPGPCRVDRNPLGTFPGCPMCGSAMAPEHAHFRCAGCGWRDSCCD